MSASSLQRLAHRQKANEAGLAMARPTQNDDSKELIETYPSYEDKKHLQFYGFPVGEEWIYKFARTCTTMQDHDNGFLLLDRIVRYLQEVIGCDEIDSHAVAVDRELPPSTTVYEESGVRYISIISVCGFYKESWPDRPTVAQVRKLEKIIGRKPSWWTDVESIQFYQ